jgi:hypothetical protein
MLRTGKNCWRISRAKTARLLIDGEAYFSYFRKAVLAAEKRILITAWDIDSHVRLLRTDSGDGYPEKLGEFLLAVLKRNKHLHIYMLLWDFSMIYALERDWSPVFNHAHWRKNRRLHLIMDGHHPAGASHHQKIVTIDDALAFVGGFDLSKWRWDTSDHTAGDERRIDPIRLLNTHLGLKKSERVQQLRTLRQLVKQDGERPTLLAGDFNEWQPLSNRLDIIKEEINMLPARPTFPAFLPLVALDRIFYKGSIRFKDFVFYRSRLRRIASDHRPLVARFYFT